jgi:hypothetical protein
LNKINVYTTCKFSLVTNVFVLFVTNVYCRRKKYIDRTNWISCKIHHHGNMMDVSIIDWVDKLTMILSISDHNYIKQSTSFIYHFQNLSTSWIIVGDLSTVNNNLEKTLYKNIKSTIYKWFGLFNLLVMKLIFFWCVWKNIYWKRSIF